MWLSKSIPAADWDSFYQECGWLEIEMAGATGIALYKYRVPDERATTVFATGPKASVAENLSPGGWTKVPAPHPDALELLAGRA
jgi:hypothetical protein